MSWNLAKKRFQRNIDKYPEEIRRILLKENLKYNLPTFDSDETTYVPKQDRLNKLEDVGIVTGDMVYISEGKHKGKISSVLQYSSLSDSFLLTDVLKKSIIPKAMWIPNQASHLMDYPESIPKKHVKLAAKDRDEKGTVSYVVADEVIMKGKYYDDNYKRWLPRRFVKHHPSIEIPWPRPPSQPEDDALSTSKDAAYLKTHELQTIAKSPLPAGLLRELRNPYSPHKRRQLTETQARKLNAPQMPLSTEQKIYLAKKSAAPEKTVQPMSEEIQEFIGSKMAEHLSKIQNPSLLAHLEALSNSGKKDSGTPAKDSE